MTKDKIYESLCYYDERNPNNQIDEDSAKKDPCYCDNCFYGRTELAEELLRVIQDADKKQVPND